MKKNLLTLWMAFLLPALFSCSPKNGDSLTYRIVPVGSSQWMSSNPRDLEEVRRQIDRIAGDGYNVISIGTYTFMPMHFIDYEQSPYPEAAHFSPERVRTNLETLREHIRYAKSRGIRYVVSRSYSHYAPYAFWEAHQEELNPGGVFDKLLRTAHQNDMFFKALRGESPYTVPQQQWTNPLFREFFLWSTEKTLDLIPELDGFLNAYAEAAWTYDTEKVRAEGWRSWKECVDYPATDSCFVDYSNTLAALLREKRGDDYFFGMRDWYVGPEVLARLNMPKDKLVISVKYAGYDQPLINYPPWGKDLLDQGFSVVLDMHIYDAEYPHPVYWYDYDIVNKSLENIREARFTGIVNQDYSLRGEDTFENPIRVLTQKTASAALRGEPFDRKNALDFLETYYGEGAENVLKSLQSVAEAQETYIKLMPAWFWRGDGLSVGGLQPPRLWMFADNPEAPGRMGFVRQNVVGLAEYVDASLSGEQEFTRAKQQWKSEGRISPPEVLGIIDRCASEAVSSIEEARLRSPQDAPYLQDLVASAFIHRELVDRSIAYTKAAIAFYRSGYRYDGKYVNEKNRVRDTGVDEADTVVGELQLFIAHDLMMRRLMLDFAPRRRVMRHANTYQSEKEMASILGQVLPVPELDEQRWEALCGRIQNNR